MRSWIAVAVVTMGPLLLAAEPQPLTPAQAAKKPREKVTVELVVKSTGGNENCYLNSEEDYKNEANFTIFLPKDTKAKLKEAGIDDPYEYYQDKTIQVTGTVLLFEGTKPRIAVTDPAQIKVVEPKKKAP